MVAFYTPTINTGGGGPGGGPGGGGPGGGGSSSTFISAPSTPSLATGNNVTNGISHFEENCYVSDNGGTIGIKDLDMEGITIKSHNGNISVEGCDNCEVRIFSIDGRQVNNSGLSTGVYIVKIGDYPAKKIIVTR